VKLDAVADRCQEVLGALGQVIVGKTSVLQQVLAGILANGHILIEDYPGLAKTLIARLVAQTLDLGFKRIQFTPDLLPSDITGSFLFDQREARFEFRRGPIFTNLLLADEINRATPKTQSALLEAMQESQVTVEGERFPLEPPFLVIATQNPIEHHGTYPLPESQLDRFLMRVQMGYPDGDSEREILRSEAGTAQLELLEPVLTGADVLEMQQAITRVRVDESLVGYVLAIVRATRESEQFSLGVSPRGSQMLYRAGQAMAFLDGRSFCVPEDFKPLVVAVFAHRVAVNGRYSSTLKKSEQAEQLMREIVESVRVPV